MRNILAICKRELLSFFVSPIAYFVITGFTLLVGYFFFNLFSIFLQQYQMAPYLQMRGMPLPNLNQVIVEGLYQTMIVILVFLVPLLTMRIVAEDKRRGTFELLLTSPVSVSEIVPGYCIQYSMENSVRKAMEFPRKLTDVDVLMDHDGVM